MQIKQHTTEQPMGQRRNQKRNKKNMEQVKTENTTYQNLCVCVLSNFRCVRLSAKICKYSKRSSKKKVYCDKLLH